ncbi:probable E3 ubiquitin-protein ligase TRIML1 [Dromiciops gliroides]|uniref:probable E3 ubiquitin-protein ligase TRIML1 n=1 Tax=Dromiciops gliroides TaxID=33562 RepID=UPI001CC59923|nr:probable E3 ubiquitin-protein ligase TRIML1 [Dromiciops gliroides]
MVGLTTCDQHGEKEKLFCEEDQRPLCESCSLAPEHKHHHVLPMDKAAEKCKVDVKTFKQSVISEYEKMYQFFQNEENQHLLRLEREFRNNMEKLKENKEKISQQIQNLQRMLLDVEENLDNGPLEMSQNKCSHVCPVFRNEEQLLEEMKLDSATWNTYPITGLREMLMTYQRDITLDAETAHPHLVVSADLKYVKCGSVPQDLLGNEERSEDVFFVLGAQTFTSGKHYWEVEWGNNTEWEVGVCKVSTIQSGNLSILPEDVTALEGFRCVNDYFTYKLRDIFIVSEPIDKMGIFLDYEKGHIAFYDVIENTLIYSPPDIIFHGTLHPYFALSVNNEDGTLASLGICPMRNE